MFRQQHPNTISQHIPTAYDGCGLGRDDPVWPRYVAEAAKWDADLINGWNKYVYAVALAISGSIQLLFDTGVWMCFYVRPRKSTSVFSK